MNDRLVQKNSEFAEKAIAEWEQFKTTAFYTIYLKELKSMGKLAALNAATESDFEQILRWQGEYRVLDRITRVPDKIVKRLRESGIPDSELLGPDLK